MKKTETTKTCTRCQQAKPLTEYYDAGRYYCNECERTEARWRMSRPENRIRTALKDAKRSAAKHNAPDDLTLDDLRYLFTLSGGRCAYTGKYTNNPSVEHIISLKNGGANTLSNVVIVDNSVNKRKNDHDPSEFLDKLAGFFVTKEIIELVAARRGVSYSEVYAEFEAAQREFNNELYRKMVSGT